MFDLFLNGEFDLIGVIIYVLSSFAVILLTLPIHEFAHAYAANRLGDPTPRYNGRLTLNPFAHIDYLGALLILLFGFGWAKPVPVDARFFKNPKRDMAITAFAGPLSNILLSFVLLIISNIIRFLSPGLNFFSSYLMIFLYYIISINIYLAVFNLLPIPPLDGSRLLSAFLPDRIYYRLMYYERYFFIIIFFLLATGSLSGFLSRFANKIYNALYFVASLPFKLF